MMNKEGLITEEQWKEKLKTMRLIDRATYKENLELQRVRIVEKYNKELSNCISKDTIRVYAKELLRKDRDGNAYDYTCEVVGKHLLRLLGEKCQKRILSVPYVELKGKL